MDPKDLLGVMDNLSSREKTHSHSTLFGSLTKAKLLIASVKGLRMDG